VLSLIPHDIQYGPQAALIAESFTPRLRYSGASLGYQLASIIAGGPAPIIATALFATYHSGYAIAIFIAACSVISGIAAAFMPDYTGKDISRNMTRDARVEDRRGAGPMQYGGLVGFELAGGRGYGRALYQCAEGAHVANIGDRVASRLTRRRPRTRNSLRRSSRRPTISRRCWPTTPRAF